MGKRKRSQIYIVIEFKKLEVKNPPCTRGVFKEEPREINKALLLFSTVGNLEPPYPI
jgi:hypothetical protein